MAWHQFQERVVDLDSRRETEKVRRFLASFDLSYSPEEVEYTMAFYRDEEVVATGSFAGEVLRNIAIHPDLQGEGIAADVVSHLMREEAKRERYHYFVFTKPAMSALFTGLGFSPVAEAKGKAALLESGVGSVQTECRKFQAAVASLPKGQRAALVMNCNPFTLGHRELIVKAAGENDSVVVFAVSEERSAVPFSVRLRLMREGTADLTNVAVVEGGPYIISAATFPGYFTKGEETVAAQTELDARVFGRHIGPSLGIVRRYVGEEPYCETTAAYNQSLQKILPEYGIQVVTVARVAVRDEIISASKVREAVRAGDWDRVRQMTPETTYRFLRSPEGAEVVQGIIGSGGRH